MTKYKIKIKNDINELFIFNKNKIDKIKINNLEYYYEFNKLSNIKIQFDNSDIICKNKFKFNQ